MQVGIFFKTRLPAGTKSLIAPPLARSLNRGLGPLSSSVVNFKFFTRQKLHFATIKRS